MKKYRSNFFLLGLFLLLFFTNPFISNEVMRRWEVPPVRVASLPQYEVGIVLGGLTTDKAPRDRVHVTGAADRILQAVHLYRKGKIKKILVSGGSGKIMKDSISEAVLLKEILIQCKIPDQDIFIESDSRNTHENAANSALVLRNKFPGEGYLLITSAYHMRRAVACFEEEGIPVDAFSVDLKSNETPMTPDLLLIPQTGALEMWETIIKELAGIVTYKVAGYI